jgi:hypothetical protein
LESTSVKSKNSSRFAIFESCFSLSNLAAIYLLLPNSVGREGSLVLIEPCSVFSFCWSF